MIALLGLLFGDNLYRQWRQSRDESEPPKFDISAINTLGERNVYEITNHIQDLPAPDVPITLTWGLQVIPTYKGSSPYGEVRVLVKDKQHQVLAEGKWDDFDRDSQTLMVPLDAHRLSREVERVALAGGFQENIFGGGEFTPPEAVLDIEIVRANLLNSPLMTDTLVLRNSPWYHYTAMAAPQGDSRSVYVYAKNLGGPSDFDVIGEVFEITEVPGSEWHNWPWVDYQHDPIANVAAGQEFTAKRSSSLNAMNSNSNLPRCTFSTYIWPRNKTTSSFRMAIGNIRVTNGGSGAFLPSCSSIHSPG